MTIDNAGNVVLFSLNAFYFYLFTFYFEMFNPTRSQVAFAIAIVGGLIVGKLIKNFKIGMMIAIVFGMLLAFSWKRRK